MKTFILLLLLTCNLLHAESKTDCRLREEIVQENLRKNFQDFDQSMGRGWRNLADKGCYLETAKFIDRYRLETKSPLDESQRQLLSWHAGQMYAFANDYKTAILRFQASLHPNEKPDDSFKWNAYVNASIAFLQHDRASLQKYADELNKASDPGNNQKIVSCFLRAFDMEYKYAYTTAKCPK